jgi:hypothetical protein
MKANFRCGILFSGLIIALLTTAVSGQTFEYNDGRKLQIEFVQEPPCPVKISVKSVDLKPAPEAQIITLEIENVSTKPIRAYAMVSGGNLHPNMHTWIFASDPFEAGKTHLRGIWPNSQDHYYFFFDYILFADGSVCGLDNHHRSIQVGEYLNSRSAAMTRLRQLAAQRLNSDDFIRAVEKSAMNGFISMDNPGPPNPDTLKRMPQRAFEHVILGLRQMKERRSEALEIAEILEKELPR